MSQDETGRKDATGTLTPDVTAPEPADDDSLAAPDDLATADRQQFAAETAKSLPQRRGVVPNLLKRGGGGGPIVHHLEMASFSLLQSKGLINNGREMVTYSGPFQCCAPPEGSCAALIPNNKLVVRHWNDIHG
ncbi:MAG: hypothetical protein FJ333_06775 [Sphingomonadales bacterium]|nr:hypothetical protein [Sphingomonadales bacterium]